LENVVPHEVDHAVRASLLRRPVERWLDEGCASLMESPAVHQHLRSAALRVPPDVVTAEWLSRRTYPDALREWEQTYAAGFSLVEFLLSLGGPRRLLEFQLDQGTIPDRLACYCGLPTETLRQQWIRRRERQRGAGCDCV